jgi:hypothetical protein
MAPRKDPHEERRRREARALEVIKAMRKSPSAPEPSEPLSPTHLPGNPDAPGVVYFVYCAGRIMSRYYSAGPCDDEIDSFHS